MSGDEAVGVWGFTEGELYLLGLKPGDMLGLGVVGPAVPPATVPNRTIPATVTRVVLVHPGGFTEKWAESWDVHIQDGGRTLKLFPRNPTEPRYELSDGFFEGIDPERVEK